MGFEHIWYTWDSIGQCHLSHMLQEDWMDTWDSSASGTRGISLDSPHLSHMVQ